MKKRNPFAVFLLSIITLGIYDIYWLVKTKEVLNKKTKIHTPSIWILFLPIILLIASVIAVFILVGHFNYSTYPSSTNTMPINATTATQNREAFVAVMFEIFAWILILPVSFYWFFKFSKAINSYTKGKMSTGVAFLLLWILHFIGVALVQDVFNDLPQQKAKHIKKPATA
jgi:NADH:ubiquinone oxidoreductase subunit 5 (subunit L)/multisubunit Na+/H+ antiporter MnhA subunit